MCIHVGNAYFVAHLPHTVGVFESLQQRDGEFTSESFPFREDFVEDVGLGRLAGQPVHMVRGRRLLFRVPIDEAGRGYFYRRVLVAVQIDCHSGSVTFGAVDLNVVECKPTRLTENLRK